jgi:hypothetical protein
MRYEQKLGIPLTRVVLAASLAAVALLTGCGGRRPLTYQTDSSLLPEARDQLRLQIVPPLAGANFSLALQPLYEEGITDARSFLRCVWSAGLEEYAVQAADRVQVLSDLTAETFTPPPDTWISYEQDNLGLPEFRLLDRDRLAEFAAHGVTHVIVPARLDLHHDELESGTAPATGQRLDPMGFYLEGPVAVVDATRQEIVWSGVIGAGGPYPLRSLTMDDLGRRTFTRMERLSYSWLAEVLQAVGRDVRHNVPDPLQLLSVCSP